METYPHEKQANLQGPGNVHYGKVNGQYYLVGDIGFSDNTISRQDGPHVWYSPNSVDWDYVGDTGGDTCSSRVPSALVKAWGLEGGC